MGIRKAPNSLKDLFSNVFAALEKEDVAELEMSDFADFIPSYRGGSELTTLDLRFLAGALKEVGLVSQPQIRSGYVSRSIGSPIYIYKDEITIDHRSDNYRYGLLLVNISVIFARIDGRVVEEEVAQIRRTISKFDFLRRAEKTALLATAFYLLKTSTSAGGSEHVRDFLKAALSKERTLRLIAGLSDSNRLALIETVKAVITCDGAIKPSELAFLQDIYRSLGISARSAKFDLEKYADAHHIHLWRKSQIELPTQLGLLEEMENILGSIMSDFDDLNVYVDR